MVSLSNEPLRTLKITEEEEEEEEERGVSKTANQIDVHEAERALARAREREMVVVGMREGFVSFFSLPLSSGL